MKFAVGYQLPEGNEEPFVNIVKDFRDAIGEVYFPWNDMPSGRAPLTARRGYIDWSGQQRLIDDLKQFKEMGLALDLLFNAACYGDQAVSVSLANKVCSILDYLDDMAGGVEAITTTSPAIAHIVQQEYPDIDVRASVNMRIGTVQGMEYVSHLFNSYYVQREYNRDLARIQQLKNWADAHDKQLCLLANSGCMYACSGQSFHDNLVAHETAIDETEKISGFMPHMCWQYLKDPAHHVSILRNTWIRPEDLHHYEELFPVIKLATRMHADPRRVIKAYAEREYQGNLLDLFEPGFGPALAPAVIDNSRFPENWWKKTSSCGHNCDSCGYCGEVLGTVKIGLDRG